MNIEDYISSGIIDSYVLGSVSPQERKEVECVAHIYPEIADALESCQKTIENYALANAVKPPSDLKAKVYQTIQEIDNEATKITKVIPLSPRKFNVYKLISIAASLLLLTFGYTYYQLNKENKILQSSTEELVILKERVIDIEKSNDDYENQIAFYTDNLTHKLELLGTEKHPDLALNLYWNKASNKVLAYGNSLPKLNKDKEYQLWAIIDGKPVSLGELETEIETIAFLEVQEVEKVQAFAVTIEPLGGSESPTMDEMQVIGMLS